MKSINFVPSACKGENPSLEGSLTLKVPNFDEKMDFQELVGSDVGDDGKLIPKVRSTVSLMRACVKLTEKFYIKIELKKKDGTEVKTFEEMSDDSDCHAILMEVATKYISGFELGKT